MLKHCRIDALFEGCETTLLCEVVLKGKEVWISSLSKPLEYFDVAKPLIPYSLCVNLTIVLRTTNADVYFAFGLCILPKPSLKKSSSVFSDSQPHAW